MNSQFVNVLLVEDSPSDARLVLEALKGTSEPTYQVEWVCGLSIGLARLNDGAIDVLLLDLGPPDNQGLAALSSIHAVAPTLPVVVLTDGGDEQLAIEAVQAGAQDYLVKSYLNEHHLTRSMRCSIARKRAEEARRDSEECLRLAMAPANEAIWECQPTNGFVRGNGQHGGISGGKPAAGQPVERLVECIHAEDRERVLRSFSEVLDGDALSWSEEYRFLDAGGNWSNIHDRVVISRDSAGKACQSHG